MPVQEPVLTRILCSPDIVKIGSAFVSTKAGKELREGLMTSAKDKKDYVTARSREAREQINSVVDRGREQVNEFAERGKEAAEKGRERWSGIVDRVSGSRSEAEHSSHDVEEPFRGGAAENRF